jgi:hypothetical protein
LFAAKSVLFVTCAHAGAPQPAVPLDDPEKWIVSLDNPAEALASREQGTATYLLAIRPETARTCPPLELTPAT